MPPPPKPTPEKYCRNCGSRMERNRFNGRLEDLAAFRKRVYCGAGCMGEWMIKEDATRSAIQKRIAIYKKPYCETCETGENLAIHHKDGDWKNNDPSNFMTLCGSCHTSLHHEQGDLTVKKVKPPCYVCGKSSYRRGLCNTHLTRLKRHGSPYVVKNKTGQ